MGGEATDIWRVPSAKGSKVWPEWLGGNAHDFRVELAGQAGQKRIAALVHKVSGFRREREAVEAAIAERIAAANGKPRGTQSLSRRKRRRMIEERRLPVTLKTTNASKVERPPESHWREVWQVLVEECGARPIGDGSAMCEQFIAYMNRDEGSFGWEFRFMGDLGFGGKFIRDNWRRQPYRVSCYPEDMTPARRELMDRANERLAALSSKNDTGGSL